MEGAHLVTSSGGDVDARAAFLGSPPRVACALPTPCAAWDVTLVLGHLCRYIERIVNALDAPTTDPVDTGRLSYWSYDRDENRARTQERACAIVGRFGSPDALLPAFSQLYADALARADAALANEPALRVRLRWGHS